MIARLTIIAVTWSPDSKWLTYARQLHNHLHGIFVYSIAGGKSTQVTDGLSDTTAPVFDATGKYLYFLASTNVGLGNGWIDMTSIARPTTSAVYVMVLSKDSPSPLAPQSDDENADKTEKKDEPAKPADDKAAADKSKDKKDDKKDTPPPDVKIDFDNIGQRILAVPIPEKNYYAVLAGKRECHLC